MRGTLGLCVTQIVLAPRSVLSGMSAGKKDAKKGSETNQLLSKLQKLNAETFSVMAKVVCMDPLDPPLN